MSERPDGCYRWVIVKESWDPEIACWRPAWAGRWDVTGEEWTIRRVHKVGVGGTLEAPPDEWVDDLPEGVNANPG